MRCGVYNIKSFNHKAIVFFATFVSTVNVSVICDARGHSTLQTRVDAVASSGCSSSPASNKLLIVGECHLMLYYCIFTPCYAQLYRYV